MKHATYQAVGGSAGSGFTVVYDASTASGEAETVAQPEGPEVEESLFENFVDEIDTWARRALAANGFGDYA